MSEATIWGQLINAGLSPAGAAGLMGNMSAESAMRSNNAQDGMTRMSDEDYTAAVDNGTYTNFVNDAVGYGLCQWTYHTRKAALLAFARSQGASIGNEGMQIAFAVKELKSEYSGLLAYLCETEDVYTAASRVCTEFERPAVNNIAARAGLAQGYFDRFNGTIPVDIPAETAPAFAAKWKAPLSMLCLGFSGDQVRVMQRLLNSIGYTVEESGDFDSDTDAVVRQFQSNNGLDADGLVGAKTWGALLNG